MNVPCTQYNVGLYIDDISTDALSKVYCGCGKILELDKGYKKRRLALHKSLECATCRNARISMEIDELNSLFSDEEEVA